MRVRIQFHTEDGINVGSWEVSSRCDKVRRGEIVVVSGKRFGVLRSQYNGKRILVTPLD